MSSVFTTQSDRQAGSDFSRQALSCRARILLWAFCIACTFNGRLVTAFEKDKYDPYFFAHVAARWVRGSVPYLEIWDNKPPGIYILGRAVFTLFYRSFPALAVVEAAFVLGAIAMVYLFLRRAGASPAAVIIGTAAGALAMNLQKYNEGGFMTENFIMLPALLSVWCFLSAIGYWHFPKRIAGGSPLVESSRPSADTLPDWRAMALWMLTAGVLTGVAALFKTVGFTTYLAEALLLAFFVLRRKVPAMRALGGVLAAAVGMFAAWLPVLLYFREHAGLGLMLRAVFGHNVGYAGSNWRVSPLYVFWHSLAALDELGTLVACAVVVLLAYSARSWFSPVAASGTPEDHNAERSRPDYTFALVILVWLAAEMGGALVGGKGFPHYFTPAMPPLAILGGMAVWLNEIRDNVFLRASLAAILLIPMSIPASQDLYRGYVALRTRQNWLPEVQAANYLNRVRKPGDTLFLCDYKPYIYFATGMQSPSRLLFAARTLFSNYDRKYADEMEEDLRRAPPTFVVCSSLEGKPLTPLQESIQAMLARDYTLVFPGEYAVYKESK